MSRPFGPKATKAIEAKIEAGADADMLPNGEIRKYPEPDAAAVSAALTSALADLKTSTEAAVRAFNTLMDVCPNGWNPRGEDFAGAGSMVSSAVALMRQAFNNTAHVAGLSEDAADEAQAAFINAASPRAAFLTERASRDLLGMFTAKLAGMAVTKHVKSLVDAGVPLEKAVRIAVADAKAKGRPVDASMIHAPGCDGECGDDHKEATGGGIFPGYLGKGPIPTC